MNRQQAMQWCVNNIIEWPKFEPSIAPEGWRWVRCFNQWILDGHCELDVPINKRTWYISKRMKPVRTFNCRSATVQISYRDNATPCGQSFSELIKGLNNA